MFINSYKGIQDIQKSDLFVVYGDLLLKNNSKFKKSWNHVKRHVKKSLPMNQAQKIYRSRYALSTK